MNLCKEIGGYFGLEINQKFDNIRNSTALNSARNCLKYIIRAYDITEIYVPHYTCSVVLASIRSENCKVKFYHVDERFAPDIDFPKTAFILYTNYFGICAKNVKKLAEIYPNLIVDNAQAFYMPKYGIASFNSIRKFFGVPDGALLYSDRLLYQNFEQDVSFQKCSHLLKRVDVGSEFGYQDFKNNDEKLGQEPIKYISNLTKSILNSIDINSAKQIRLQNFKYLHTFLSKTNEFNIELDKDDVPMVYPYLRKNDNLKKGLIQNKIYVATYWEPIEAQENIFQKYLIPLPIDQRYDESDMEHIIKIIKKLEEE